MYVRISVYSFVWPTGGLAGGRPGGSAAGGWAGWRVGGWADWRVGGLALVGLACGRAAVRAGGRADGRVGGRQLSGYHHSFLPANSLTVGSGAFAGAPSLPPLSASQARYIITSSNLFQSCHRNHSMLSPPSSSPSFPSPHLRVPLHLTSIDIVVNSFY